MALAHLLVTVGDPRGIGPEVALNAVDSSGPGNARVTFIGPDGELTRDEVAGMSSSAEGRVGDDSDAEAGGFAARSIERAVELARAGEAQAIVTGPLHKPSLHAAGWRVPGQTEMLRDLCGAARVGMFMVAEETRLGGSLRVLLATTHIPLASVPATITEGLIVDQLDLVDQALRCDWGIARPRIALCGLNPHASDSGLFGEEESLVLVPAIARARASGTTVVGPLPADTVFTRALAGDFDAVVAPYHDVGMAAFKTAAFGRGVNVTLGLPFVRTSPDHGTAFDLAGTGRADAGSMREALDLAAALANKRFDMDSADV